MLFSARVFERAWLDDGLDACSTKNLVALTFTACAPTQIFTWAAPTLREESNNRLMGRSLGQLGPWLNAAFIGNAVVAPLEFVRAIYAPLQ